MSSRIKCVLDRLATLSIPAVRVEVIASYIKSFSLEALKMYCVMRASLPSLYSVYRLK